MSVLNVSLELFHYRYSKIEINQILLYNSGRLAAYICFICIYIFQIEPILGTS